MGLNYLEVYVFEHFGSKTIGGEQNYIFPRNPVINQVELHPMFVPPPYYWQKRRACLGFTLVCLSVYTSRTSQNKTEKSYE